MYLLQLISYHCRHQLSLNDQYSLGILLTEYFFIELLDMEDLLNACEVCLANSKKLSSWPAWKKEDRTFLRQNKGAPKSQVHKIRAHVTKNLDSPSAWEQLRSTARNVNGHHQRQGNTFDYVQLDNWTLSMFCITIETNRNSFCRSTSQVLHEFSLDFGGYYR